MPSLAGKRIAITGAAGLLGTALSHVASAQGAEIAGFSRLDLDITDPASADRALGSARPDIVIHSAANPDPDSCETNPIGAYAVNAGGTEVIAHLCRIHGARLVHISTDAVFDGTASRPYTETDPTHPINVYGRTKLAAERAAATCEGALIARISVLFGPPGHKGASDLVNKAIAQASAGKPVRAASDQVSTAVYTMDAAEIVLAALVKGHGGILHVSNSGICSRFDIVRQTLVEAGLDPSLAEPVSIRDLDRPARRAAYFPLDNGGIAKLGLPAPRSWQDALRAYLSTRDK